MKKIGFMVIGCLFWTLIAIEGVYSVVPLIPVPTTKRITGTRTITPIIQTPSIPPTRCPNLYSYNSAYGKCYYTSASRMGFIAANDTCVNSGGSLLIAKTNDEQLLVAQMIPGSGSNNAWIGVTYRTINGTADYYWLDGTPLTTCKWGMSSPYSSYLFMTLRKSDHCATNLVSSYNGYVLCQGTPLNISALNFKADG